MQCAADADYVCDVIPASTENIQLHSKKKKDSKYEYYEDSIDDDAFFYMVRKWLNFCNIDGIHAHIHCKTDRRSFKTPFDKSVA